MVDFNVTIGVTDDMVGSSINILEGIMDPLGHVPDLFAWYRGETSKSTDTHKQNVSPVSTESILQTIQRDHRSLYEDLIEYVKYKQQVTDFAVAFQRLQLKAMYKLSAP